MLKLMTVAALLGISLGCGGSEPVDELVPTPTAQSNANPVLIAVQPTSSPSPAPDQGRKTPSQQARRKVAEPGGDDLKAKTGTASVVAEIRRVFRSHADDAIRIARCESKLNPRATGKASERGLLQLHPVHRRWIEPRWGWDAMYEVRPNIEAAHHLFKREGFRPWRFSRRCHGVA